MAQQAREPTELEKKQQAMALENLNFYSQKAPNYSPDNLPASLRLGYVDEATQQAINRRQESKTGTGLTQMGSHGISPGYFAQLKEQRVRRGGENAALGLVDAVSRHRAETMGTSQTAIGNALNRTSLAGNMLGNASTNSMNLYGMIPRSKPWWEQALSIGATAAPFLAGI